MGRQRQSWEGGSHQPRAAWSPQMLEEAGPSLEPLEGAWPWDPLTSDVCSLGWERMDGCRFNPRDLLSFVNTPPRNQFTEQSQQIVDVIVASMTSNKCKIKLQRHTCQEKPENGLQFI